MLGIAADLVRQPLMNTGRRGRLFHGMTSDIAAAHSSIMSRISPVKNDPKTEDAALGGRTTSHLPSTGRAGRSAWRKERGGPGSKPGTHVKHPRGLPFPVGIWP